MKAVESEAGEAVDGKTAGKFAGQSVAKGGEIRTDGLAIYKPSAENGYTLNQKEYDPKKQPKHLHWIHILISNAKALTGGTFHGLGPVHLQRYLDEFRYRFNRRRLKSGVFSRLVSACAFSQKITCHELVG